jgi:hypothetical protein
MPVHPDRLPQPTYTRSRTPFRVIRADFACPRQWRLTTEMKKIKNGEDLGEIVDPCPEGW